MHNTATTGTEYLVTLNTSDGTDIGTFSLDGYDTVIIRKQSTDKLFEVDGIGRNRAQQLREYFDTLLKNVGFSYINGH